MNFDLLAVILCFIGAAFIAFYINPSVVKLAYRKRILDNPNVRKLQKSPVPVIGGISVFMTAMIVLLMVSFFYKDLFILFFPVLCLTVIFFIGLFDDIMDISFITKFAFQILVVFCLWFHGIRLDDLGGILGLHHIGIIPSLVLSIIAGVGLINALNLIDGVDGLSSGLGIYAGLVCGVTFLLHGDMPFAIVAFTYAGALIPFFIFNVFSRKYKMFIGDAGSLVMGTLAYIFTCQIIHEPRLYSIDNYSIAMMLVLYAVPVFDTLRVMTMRMAHGHSPFMPDKTHLHHIFVFMRFPHIAITGIILLVSIILYLFWLGLSLTGLSTTWVTVISTVVSAAIVWGLYFFNERSYRLKKRQYARQVLRARNTRRRLRNFYHRVQCLVDRRYYRDKSL